MTPKNDGTVRSGTLPLPELNPLLNPTLNKHLGRWAEVYFTNPPEKRDQAVVNLLRELERETMAADGVARLSFQNKIKPRRSMASPNAVICRDCGFENEPPQKFCGECGALLGAPATTAATAIAERAGARESEPDSPRSELVEPPAPQFGSILHLSDAAPRRLTGAELAEYAESAPLRHSYRLYIAAGLALIIGGLVYVGWRGGQFASDRTIFSAPSPPPPATQSASTAAPAATSPAPPAESTSTSTPAPASTTAIPNSEPERASKPARAAEAAAVSGTPADLPGNGSQELALAQHLLSGVGKDRDTATAAQWLWKAVQKQNTAATVLLAGLYLRGDGVPKNCDQGRVLLDAAATKKNKDAANLLRNLQAFGCE